MSIKRKSNEAANDETKGKKSRPHESPKSIPNKGTKHKFGKKLSAGKKTGRYSELIQNVPKISKKTFIPQKNNLVSSTKVRLTNLPLKSKHSEKVKTKETLFHELPDIKGANNTSKAKFGKKSSLKKKKGSLGSDIKSIKSTKVVANQLLLEKKKSFMKKKGKPTYELSKKLIRKDGKPQWSKVKDEKLKLKETRKIRQSGQDQYNLSLKAKKIWEQLRLKTNSAEKRESLVNDLFMMLKGKIPNIVRSHDMARVVQWMLKLGSSSVRTAICEELCSNAATYMQAKFASHCIKRALRYGTKTERNHLIQSCNGQFLRLLSNTFASPIVETMYTMFASAEQRRQMQRELYGEMQALLTEDIATIEHIPKDIKPSILAATKTNLTKLLAKKEFLKSTLIMAVLLDYMANCSEQDREEISELIQGDILELIFTKEGCRVALYVIWSATNKIKKVMIKSLKGKVKEIATSEEAHILLMALFDSIDDTVLVNKALIPELVCEAEELAGDECGRKVILYLVAHRDTRYFHPQQIGILSKGDSINKRKKDTTLRANEMLDAVSGPLLQRITENPAFWLGESSVSMVTLAIMKSGKGSALQEAFGSVVDYIIDPKTQVEVNDREFHVIEHTAVHLVLKKLIKQDEAKDKSGSSETFSSVLANKLSRDHLKHILQFNRGCFLLVLLFESENPLVCNFLQSKLAEPLKALLKKQETTGAKILLKKLKSYK